MKKLICILSVFTLLLASCSSDNAEDTGVLVKRIVSTSPGDTPRTFNYIYQGNKLVKISPSPSINVENTFTGNLVTYAKQYYVNGPLATEAFYEYDSQQRVVVSKILIHTMDSEVNAEKMVYTYSPDNTVSYQKFSGNHTTQNTLIATGKIWLNSNGEELKTEEYRNGELFRKEIKTYDDKNSAFKNAVGFEKLYGGNNTMTHNVLTSATYDENGTQIGGYTNVFTYNESDYPVSAVSTTFSSGSPTNMQFFYE